MTDEIKQEVPAAPVMPQADLDKVELNLSFTVGELNQILSKLEPFVAVSHLVNAIHTKAGSQVEEAVKTWTDAELAKSSMDQTPIEGEVKEVA